ncbi:MAG: isochorismatase family protein [Subdoligranulum sp.]
MEERQNNHLYRTNCATTKKRRIHCRHRTNSTVQYQDGYCTDSCVISNAMVLRAAFPETEIEVLSDCCAGVTPQSHQTALDAMRACQFTII